MKLSDFLSVLVTNQIQVTLVDLNTNAEIATFKADGYESLDDTIEEREVKQWSIISVASLKVVLGDAI